LDADERRFSGFQELYQKDLSLARFARVAEIAEGGGKTIIALFQDNIFSFSAGSAPLRENNSLSVIFNLRHLRKSASQ
jgi:hypothetical protein